jgi:hypothetical protein
MSRLRSKVLGALAALVMVLGGLAALAVGGSTTSAFAEEPGSFYNRLNGASVGLPLGAAAPAGVYTGLETAYLGWPGSGTGNQGCPGASSLSRNGCLAFPAIAQAVPLVWSTGWNFLGASYAVSVVAAFYEGLIMPSEGPGSLGNPPINVGPPACQGLAPTSSSSACGFVEVANPLWQPLFLSWNLGGGWFGSVAFDFMAPIGTQYASGTPVGRATQTNPDYWTFEPAWAISYLGSNWVASANFFYDINGPSRGACCFGPFAGTVAAPAGAGDGYTSGEILYVDMQALYKLGKWQFGPVGYIEAQTTQDRPGGGFSCAAIATTPLECGYARNFAVGGLVGYDFGPVDLQVWVTDSVWRDNQIDGLDVWTRIGFRIWGPETPKPMVAKN